MELHHLTECAPGVFLWRATHPDWNTDTERVACYALRFDDGVLLVDPLLHGTERDDLVAELRALAAGDPVHAYVTIPFHVRDTEVALDALGGEGACIVGHADLARRLRDTSRLVDWAGDGELPFGVQAIEAGDPRRHERPLYSPTHHAVVVGDVAIGIRDGVRIWHDFEDGNETWYREGFVPGMRALLDLDVEHVLVTHGDPVIGVGAAALEAALREEPVKSIKGELSGEALPG